MNRTGSLLWFDRPILVALALTSLMYVVAVLVGGVRGEYIAQPAVLAIVLGALLARWRLGLGWLLAIIGMLGTATLLFSLAATSLYPDGTVTLDHPGGDLSRLGEFRPAFILHLVAIVLATGMATILANRVVGRRSVLVTGVALMLAISVVGTVTLVTGDWLTYEILMTLPIPPWAFGAPVYALLLFAGLWWAAGVAGRVRQQANMAPRADRLPVIKMAVLGELVPAFAGAQRSGVAAERARFATELHASVLPAIRSVVQSADPSGPVSPDLRARLTELEVELRRIADGKRNVLLDEFGLVGAIEDLVEGTQHDHGIPIELQVNGDIDLGRPPRQVEQVAFDICRLALDNAVRHSDPRGILVVVGPTRASLVLEVTDDGRGLGADDIQIARQAGRRGVSDMQTAARSVSGHLVIEGVTAGGTRVSFKWGAL